MQLNDDFDFVFVVFQGDGRRVRIRRRGLISKYSELGTVAKRARSNDSVDNLVVTKFTRVDTRNKWWIRESSRSIMGG